jgi:hypothetical protein
VQHIIDFILPQLRAVRAARSALDLPPIPCRYADHRRIGQVVTNLPSTPSATRRPALRSPSVAAWSFPTCT